MTINGLRRRAAMLCMLGLVMFAACGGSSDSSSTSIAEQTDDGGATTPEASAMADQPEETSAAPEASTGDGGAMVTIDGADHQFGPEQVRICIVDENGIFRATIANDDYTQTVELSLPPEGFVTDDPLSAADQYPSVSFVQSDAEIWLANAYESDPTSVNNRNIPEGQTQVDSYDFDSTGASGTATFLNMQALTVVDASFTGEPVSGSFEVSCG